MQQSAQQCLPGASNATRKMIDVGVNITDAAGPALAKLIKLLDGQDISNFNEAGAKIATSASIDYHRDYNNKNGWRGDRYLAGPGRQSGNFAQNITLGWNFVSASKQGATIRNSAPFYAHKVTGGTIRPRTAKALTIPMIPDAAGRKAGEYQTITGNLLFRVMGKKALFEKTEGGGIRAVYALVKQVTQKPWPGALPDKDLLEDSFTKGWLGAFSDTLESL